MKITKYLAITLLLVVVGKKTVFASEVAPDGTITGPPMLQNYDNWIIRRQQNNTPTNNDKLTFTVNPQALNEVAGLYNTNNNTATIEFTQVTTSSKAVTPPNVTNPSYVAFGSMPNPKNYKGTRNLSGGQSAQETLWGIPAYKSSQPAAVVIQPGSSALSAPKKYNATNKTATALDGSVYVGVVEYSQSVTPPNLAIPALQQFAKIKNPTSSGSKAPGAPKATTILWGLKVTGHKEAIKQGNTTIGYLWAESNIAQLNNGETVVAIMSEPQGNYKPRNAHAMGPVWTRYSQQQLESMKNMYHIVPSNSNVQLFGTVQIDGQTNNVYGINLQQNAPTARNPQLAATLHQPFLQPPHNLQNLEEQVQADASTNLTSGPAIAALYNLQQ